ncbi:MAG: MFS transporter [Agarilytica sp.]
MSEIVGSEAVVARSESMPLRKDADFRWLALGSMTSALGDQLTMVAFPWLVLSLTSESWVLGLVFALIGLPRAVFILIGGAVVDRFSSKTVMLVSKYISFTVLSVATVLIFLEALTIPVLCLLSFLIGMSGAFSLPASRAIVPIVVGHRRLEKANGFLMVIGQLIMIVGPIIAGLILGNSVGKDTDSAALAILFGFDAFTYAFSALTLFFVNCPKRVREGKSDRLLKSILHGVVTFWSNRPLRALTLYISVASCIVGGLMQLGLPLMVKDVFSGGGSSFGFLLAASGLGTTVGVVVASAKVRIGGLSLGVSFLVVDVLIGVLIVVLSGVQSLTSAFVVIFFMGLLGGYIHIGMISWVQKQASQEMLGRMLSIIMFITMGLIPISSAIFGVLLKYASVESLFFGVGLILSVVAVMGLFSRDLRSIQS